MMNLQVLKTMFIVLSAIFCLQVHPVVAEEPLPRTPPDHEGPFYPVTRQQDIDNDLVHVTGRSGVARGDILNLSGVVVNTMGKPLTGVIIEIWQTDPQGRYNHPGDSTPGERDPNFQYWGAATTGADGSFFFKTVVPGAYPPRPAHIHFKVWRKSKLQLTSQIYFHKPAEEEKIPALTDRMELQSVKLQKTGSGEYDAFFRIVL